LFERLTETLCYAAYMDKVELSSSVKGWPMPGIFISYRRDDCGGYALSLYRVLREKFGPEHVFRDFDTVLPGRDFVKVIEETLSSCEVLIALIGNQWLAMTQQRLNDPEDFTRLEIARALERNILVIPVLVPDLYPHFWALWFC